MAQQNARSEVERLDSRFALLTPERGDGAHKNRVQLDIDIKEIERRVGGLGDSIEIDRVEREEVDGAETARREEWVGRKASLSEFDRAVSIAVRLAEERQNERMRILQERAARESALQSAIDRLEDTTQRAQIAVQETEVLADSLREGRAREIEAQSQREAVKQLYLGEFGEILDEEADMFIQTQRLEISAARNSLRKPCAGNTQRTLRD